jgi:hypothetical protein
MNILKSYSLFALITVSIFISSCVKETTGNTGGGSAGGSTETSGSLIINVTWSTPAPTAACPFPVFIKIELNGPGGYSFTQDFTTASSSAQLDKRLTNGDYTYIVTKLKNPDCSSFSPATKAGTFTITGCPIICNNGTVINITFN